MVNRVGVDIFGDGLSHGGPDEVDPMGIVDDAVEDGVGEGGFADDVVPLRQPDWPLWIGIGGRIKSESVAALDWNQWPLCVGMRKEAKLLRSCPRTWCRSCWSLW